MAEEFRQDRPGMVRVLKLRYGVGVVGAAAVLGLLFGWLAVLASSWMFRLVVAALPLAILSATALLAFRAIAVAKRSELGALKLTQGGVHFESHDHESISGSVPWMGVGSVSLRADWQSRRAGLRTLVVLPLGATSWHRSGLRGSRGNALMVVCWLTQKDATSAESLIKKHQTESAQGGQA